MLVAAVDYLLIVTLHLALIKFVFIERTMTEEPEIYRRVLQGLISKAQQVDTLFLSHLLGVNFGYYRNIVGMHL